MLTVVVRPGVIVPLEAVRHLWNLEARGFFVGSHFGRKVCVLPAPTPADARATHRHEAGLLALLSAGKVVH